MNHFLGNNLNKAVEGDCLELFQYMGKAKCS